MKVQTTDAETFGLHQAKLREQGEIRIQIASGSMEPLIPTGSVHSVVPLTSSRRGLRPFDIIVFWDKKVLICHFVWSVNRVIVSKEGPWITTRCLAHPGEDFPILENQILGRLQGVRIPSRVRLWIILKTVWRQALYHR